jgi:hypothetical protein
VGNSSFNLNKYSQEKKQVKEDEKKKKDSRGNPFRVLMGKAGKLIDHGLPDRDIVRYLLKEKIWPEDTIRKAIKIVKDYSKKKHLKKKKVEAQTLMNTAEEWPKMTPDFTKRSNAELITSICWLHSLDKANPKKVSFDHKEVADRTGVKDKIRKIKSELIKRGMSEEDLNLILK